ncbi:hypothetical protein PMIN01_07602 [Paraphaeosphaeria minitans]|uniref:Uncharacterized protein n=1 Tax=Paraphaeosphaeria minitans TaxID=565426 RepID=A0A9P6GFX7_9PLEO|nr:hypothetical protein PMIN01_07602 [Paraphaeosphaeria minitans]
MPALSGARATGASDKHETPGHVHQTHIRLPGGVLLKGHFALRAVVALGLCFMKANIQLPSYTAHHATYSVTCIAASQEPANPLNRAQRFHLFDRVSIASRHRRAVVVARKLLPLKEEPPRICHRGTATDTKLPTIKLQIFTMQNVSFAGTSNSRPTGSLP